MPLATSESISDSGSEDESGLCLSPFTACEDGDQSDDWQELAQKLREDYLKECFDENGRFLQYDKDDKKQGCKSAIRTVNCSEAIKVYVDLAPQELKRVDDQKEQFSLIFVLQLWWLDPNLKNFQSKLRISRPLQRPNGQKSERFLQEIDIVVRTLRENGDLVYEELETGMIYEAKKSEYTFLQPPNWEGHFFPEHSFINQADAEEGQGIHMQKKQLLWCDENGGFVHYKAKCDRVFEETLELRRFPVDSQLCRVKLTAEMPIEEFQFITIETARRLVKQNDMWDTDTGSGNRSACVVYVRQPDHFLPEGRMTQRSLVNLVLQIQRKPDFFFHSVWLMVVLINSISLCSFGVRPSHHSGRLSFLSTCFLAVLAYRYIVNDSLPKKSYMTYADQYIIFGCLIQTALCVWTFILMAWWRMSSDEDEHVEPAVRASIVMADVIVASITGFALLFVNCLVWGWQKSGWFRQSWKDVYDDNTEPFFPIDDCHRCGERRLSKQCTHASGRKQCQNADCAVKGKAEVPTRYLTPMDGLPAVVPSLKEREPRDRVETYLKTHYCSH